MIARVTREREPERIESGVLWRWAAFVTGALLCLTPWGSPPVALAVGMALALTMENPLAAIGKKASKWLLQACVVALGFGMNLSVVLQAGKSGMLMAAGSIAATFLLGAILGRMLRIARRTSVLISAGTAICGGSAIAAVGSVVNAAEEEMTVAMGVVFLLNAAALYLFPLIGHSLSLTQEQFGVWAGIAIHDVSSVVGAASRYGLTALQTATAVKLSRALWIIPVSFAAAFAFRTSGKTDQAEKRGAVQIPWFIGLFILASLARSFVPGIAATAPEVTHFATMGLTLTLFLIGAGVSRKTLKAVGWKPLAQGVLLWAAISIGSLLIVMKS